jgi:DNA-damage-inducible protein D
MEKDLASTVRNLDTARKISAKGTEYWMARDISPIMGYPEWENFDKVVKKAFMACESTGVDPDNHFRDATKMVIIGSGAKRNVVDFFLSRYACYLIAMNGDPRKPEIGTAQSYFADQTRRQEIFDKLTENERRIQLRDRVKKANVSLGGTAKRSGVQRFGVFQDAGYKGLYEMGLSDIKRKKGIGEKENLLDRAGRTELAANEFRITQTEEKLIRDKVDTESHAIITHREVGQEVRNVIRRIGGRMPEDLPPEESIKKLVNKSKIKRIAEKPKGKD